MIIIGKRGQLVEGKVRDPVCEEDGRIQKTVYGHGEDAGGLLCGRLRGRFLQDKNRHQFGNEPLHQGCLTLGSRGTYGRGTASGITTAAKASKDKCAHNRAP